MKKEENSGNSTKKVYRHYLIDKKLVRVKGMCTNKKDGHQ